MPSKLAYWIYDVCHLNLDSIKAHQVFKQKHDICLERERSKSDIQPRTALWHDAQKTPHYLQSIKLMSSICSPDTGKHICHSQICCIRLAEWKKIHRMPSKPDKFFCQWTNATQAIFWTCIFRPLLKNMLLYLAVVEARTFKSTSIISCFVINSYKLAPHPWCLMFFHVLSMYKWLATIVTPFSHLCASVVKDAGVSGLGLAEEHWYLPAVWSTGQRASLLPGRQAVGHGLVATFQVSVHMGINGILGRSRMNRQVVASHPTDSQSIIRSYRIFFILDILLMEEILHHLGCMKPYN